MIYEEQKVNSKAFLKFITFIVRLGHQIGKMKNFHSRIHLFEATAPAREFFIGQARILEKAEATTLLTAAYQDAPSVAEIVAPFYKKAEGLKDEVNKMQYLDIHQWLPKDILLKADKLSMASSLELRVPLLDIEMMNLAQTIPTKYLINQNNTKDVFRQAAKRHLPKEWANREKLGFPVPIKSWLKEETGYTAVKILFADDFAAEFFDQAAILQMLDDHRKNQVNLQRKIWTIFTFLTWYKVFFIDQEIPQSQQIIYETIV